MTLPALTDLLRRGATEFNRQRKAGNLARDFSGATLVQVNCANADLSALDLSGSEWDRCELSKINFHGADLSNSYFHRGRLDDCDFKDVDLSGASFEKLRLSRCDFTGAKGLEELELTDVDLRDVVGLPTDEDEDEDEDEDSGVVVLRERLPKGYQRLPLDQLITVVGKHVSVQVSPPCTEPEVRAMEELLRIKFPADHRAFLTRIGGLSIVGERSLAFGHLRVFGASDLESAHRDYLLEFDEESFKPGWLDERLGPKLAGALAEHRGALRDQLKLGDAQLKRVMGDRLDAMRVANQFMVPVMLVPGEMKTLVECVGPDSQMYSVSIKDLEVGAPSGTFTSSLVNYLENIIVENPAEEA